MKNKIIKGLSLGAMLALCLALTGCYVPPEDLDDGSTSNNYRPFNTVVPSKQPTSVPTTARPVQTNTPEPTVNWNDYGQSGAATTAGGIDSIVNITPNRITPNVVTTPPATTASSATSLKAGSTGAEVRQMQKRLKELGYYKGSVDGDFGENTELAVRAFQEQNGLTVDGKAGANTLDRLYSDSARKAPSTVTATPRRTATPTPKATAVPDTDVYLENGSSGSKVRTLQTRLIELGWMSGKADGSFAGATEYAVLAFQKEYDSLWDDGVAGPGTLEILYSSNAKKASRPVSSIGVTLREGESSDAVRAMQTRLKELGFLSGKADGSFGQATKAAVIAFQTANGLKADGKAGTSTLNMLYSSDAKAADSLTNSEDASSGVVIDGYTTLREGDTGSAVTNLQRALKNRGYYSGSLDGKYGSGTVAAVIAFQQRNGLRVDGTAGPATQKALYGSGAESANNEYETLRPGDSSTAVRNMQYTLYELGYYDGTVDGVYGDTTKDAVRAFQIRNDIEPVDGIAGDKTLKVLFSSKAIAAAAETTEYDTLRKGDIGNSVVEMQDSLQQLGYLTEVTGLFDDATVEAVKNFQRRNGLTVDGAAGSDTLRVLYSDDARTAY